MISFEKITLMSSNLGKPNNIPDITPTKSPLWFTHDESVSEKESELFGVGMISTILPYKLNNLYDRNIKPLEYSAAILENENLKAVFLPELGGRLWSLYDKKLKKDIIYKNDAVIFANLALRNAWFAGGVEWNVGVRGHSFFTTSTLFAQKVKGKLGHDILRMYEYEEIRGLVYCLEATLEGDSLLINVTVKNTKAAPTYMYWWSNIAVEQKAGTRVFVPADRSFVTSYRDGGFCISKIDIPNHNGKDTSDLYHAYDAIDYFYDIPDENKKWISSVESDGTGLLQYSDARLFGRKTFLWGSIPGGVHWNSWLTVGRDYYEIQAGLCKTQFEHFTIDAYEELTWNEVYKGITVEEYDGNYSETCKKIDSLVPEKINCREIFTEKSKDAHFTYGSGKGYLYEKISGERFHEKCDFPMESVGDTEKYYLDLLDGKEASGNESTDFVIGKQWRELIESKRELSAFDKYVLSILYYLDRDYDSAMKYLTESVGDDEKYYSLAALALLCSNVFDRGEDAFRYAKRAVEIEPSYLPVAVKYGEIAIKYGKYDDFIEYYVVAPAHVKEAGRIKMYVGQCLVNVKNTEYAKEFINEDLVVEDFKEGEYSISEIWVELYRQEMAKSRGVEPSTISKAEVLTNHPLPYKIDFRMH